MRNNKRREDNEQVFRILTTQEVSDVNERWQRKGKGKGGSSGVTGQWPIKFVRLCTQNGFCLLLANCSPGSV